MKDLRTDPRVRNLAIVAYQATAPRRYGQLPDGLRDAEVADLHKLGKQLLRNHGESSDLAELAAKFVDTAEHRAELRRSAGEILKLQGDAMRPRTIVAVGTYLIALGAAVLAIAPWAWSLATSSINAKAGTVRAHFLWLGFTPTAEFCLIIIVALMAILGSIAIMILTFANRAGQQTLEQGFLWWYLTRPIAAAAVGVLFYMAVIAGFFNRTSATGRSALVLAAAIGGIAGLFTDKVLQKMRDVFLGLSPFDRPAGSATAAVADRRRGAGG